MNEEKFRKYLSSVISQVNTTFDKKTIDDMIDILKNRVPNKLEINTSLLDISDIKYCQGVKKKLAKKGDLNEFNQAYKTGRPSQALYRYIDFLENMAHDNINVMKSQKLKVKNIILYGSPGVGKTHNTNKLIKLIESGESEKDIFKEIKENKKESIELDVDVKSRTKFITFHQSFGYEDFIEGFRPNEEGNIELVDGIFKIISNKAQKNLDDSKLDISNNRVDADELIKRFTNYVQDSIDEEKEFSLMDKITIESINDKGAFLLGGSIKSNTQRLTPNIIKRDYETFREGKITSYEDVKPTHESQRTFHGNARYYYFIYQKLREFEKTLNISAIEQIDVPLQNYYLVIDEINRGNISKIFGELITLIEEDKRDKVEVTLPYSKQPFKIPSNLYIIGTMNSNDKSIALIDIALRRRFTFLKMEPNAKLIDNSEAKALFIKLNEHIRDSHLGEDYQIGHSYFMGIESHGDLEFVWEYKIKPLLEEYFYGDEEGFDKVLKLKNVSD